MDQKVKSKESEKRDTYQNLARELKMQRNITVTVIPIVIGALSTVFKGLERELEELDESRPSKLWDFKIDQNTEKSPEDPRRLVVTQTPIKDH